MSLSDLISRVEGQRKTLTVFNPDRDDLVPELREYFAEQNLEVREAETTSGRPVGFAMLAQGETFLTGAATDDLWSLMHDTPEGPEGLGFDDSDHYELLQYLKETTFTAYGKEQMVTASREIEDRAWRVQSGTLHAGFQYASIMDAERDIYRNLAKSDLDIHVYGAPDDEPPEFEGSVTVHVEDAEEIRRSWFVVFDGDGDDAQKSALLAEERDPDRFYGFWTYSPDVVDEILDHLESRYGHVSQ